MHGGKNSVHLDKCRRRRKVDAPYIFRITAAFIKNRVQIVINIFGKGIKIVQGNTAKAEFNKMKIKYS